MFGGFHNKYGLADQVGWKNIRNARAGVDVKLSTKCTWMGRYDLWWLADPHDALYSASGAVIAADKSGAAGRFVGHEVDSEVAYTISKQWLAAGGYGHLFPGTFLKNATAGKAYNFLFTSTTFVF